MSDETNIDKVQPWHLMIGRMYDMAWVHIGLLVLLIIQIAALLLAAIQMTKLDSMETKLINFEARAKVVDEVLRAHIETTK